MNIIVATTDRVRAHFDRQFRRTNVKMSDEEDQIELPAAAMAMPVMNVNDNAGTVEPHY